MIYMTFGELGIQLKTLTLLDKDVFHVSYQTAFKSRRLEAIKNTGLIMTLVTCHSPVLLSSSTKNVRSKI